MHTLSDAELQACCFAINVLAHGAFDRSDQRTASGLAACVMSEALAQYCKHHSIDQQALYHKLMQIVDVAPIFAEARRQAEADAT